MNWCRYIQKSGVSSCKFQCGCMHSECARNWWKPLENVGCSSFFPRHGGSSAQSCCHICVPVEILITAVSPGWGYRVVSDLNFSEMGNIGIGRCCRLLRPMLDFSLSRYLFQSFHTFQPWKERSDFSFFIVKKVLFINDVGKRTASGRNSILLSDIRFIAGQNTRIAFGRRTRG